MGHIHGLENDSPKGCRFPQNGRRIQSGLGHVPAGSFPTWPSWSRGAGGNSARRTLKRLKTDRRSEGGAVTVNSLSRGRGARTTPVLAAEGTRARRSRVGRDARLGREPDESTSRGRRHTLGSTTSNTPVRKDAPEKGKAARRPGEALYPHAGGDVALEAVKRALTRAGSQAAPGRNGQMA